MPLSLAHLDYLQRLDVDARVMDGFPPPGDPSERPIVRLLRVHAVAATRGQPVAPAEKDTWVASLDALTGLAGLYVPLVFVVSSDRTGIAIRVGTWTPPGASAERDLVARETVLRGALDCAYPGTDLRPDAAPLFEALDHGGLVLGTPTPKRRDETERAGPIDRLIRALEGGRWAAVVLAEPVSARMIRSFRDEIIGELQAVSPTSETARMPLNEYYVKLLNMARDDATMAATLGGWRTAVYLLGDAQSYFRLATVWQGVFAGEESLPEPVSVRDSPRVPAAAAAWFLPAVADNVGPGHVRRPLRFQSILSTLRLAAYVQLPTIEAGGFRVRPLPRFAAGAPNRGDRPSVKVGSVLSRWRRTQDRYAVPIDDLTKHVFLAGVTGSGKTNAIFKLLLEARDREHPIPFLVIEPAKTEYRSLLRAPEALGQEIQVFTLGNELVSPFRLNPFEVLEGTNVSVHLDMLRSVFTASFGMWTPLPQVLERCLHHIYEDRGWNLTTNTNPRLSPDSDRRLAFPTLTDLVRKVDEVVPTLGYEEKVASDIRAALQTRIESLRIGGKGRMLDGPYSLPASLIVGAPTVLELEGMGDDDDKAFMMGILLVRMWEYWRSLGRASSLRHLLVIEEAHRLLANVGGKANREEGDPRGKAVETFTNLLSEVRAYGQGIIVADQVPTKLAPDVIKNTNLKIALRVVAEEDRRVLAGAMVMDEEQAEVIATFEARQGHAAVFSEGAAAPSLVSIDNVKDRLGEGWPEDNEVARAMAERPALAAARSKLLPHPRCAAVTPTGNGARNLHETIVDTLRNAARDLAETPPFRRDFVRLVISIFESDVALDRLWKSIVARAQSAQPGGSNHDQFLRLVVAHATDWLASRRGAQGGWSYTDTSSFAEALGAVLLAKLEGRDCDPPLEPFRDRVRIRHQREHEPFPRCDDICREGDVGRICWYRYAVQDLVPASPAVSAWRQAATDALAAEADAQGGDSTVPFERWFAAWEIAQRQAGKLVDLANQGAIRRIALCYAEHLLADELPETHALVMQQMIECAAAWTGDGGDNG